jgi:hypothetical protein
MWNRIGFELLQPNIGAMLPLFFTSRVVRRVIHSPEPAMSEAVERELNQGEFDRVIHVLEGEQKAMQPSKAQRFSYWLYTAFVSGLVLSVLVTIALQFTQVQEISSANSDVRILFLIAIVACFFGGIFSLLLNLPLAYKIIRQRLAVRRLGFSGTTAALWKAHQATHRISVIIGRTSMGLGIVLLLLGVGFGLFYRGDPTVSSMVGIGFGLLLIMFSILSAGKSWLDMMSNRWQEVTKLKESILSLKNTAPTPDGHIAISPEAIRQFAKIEKEQIARSRIKAVAESASASKQEYSILSSRDALKAKAALNPSDRLKIEQAIDDLSLEPQPAGVEIDPSGRLHCPVKGTDLALVYTIDNANRQLKLLSLQGYRMEGVASV